jgi:hypothetical protein
MYKFVRTSSKMDAGLYKIYLCIGLRFSVHTGGFDLKVVDPS